jgi:hypothetical protein
MNPCHLAAVVAPASTARYPSGPRRGELQFNRRFLDEALGKDRGDAARRAVTLGSCPDQQQAYRPEWTFRLIEVLYRGPDLAPGPRGDTQSYFREVAAGLMPQLGRPGERFRREAQDSLERLVDLAWGGDFDQSGKIALAKLLTHPDTLPTVANDLASSGAASSETRGFRMSPTNLREVLATLAADPKAGPIVQEGASRLAQEALADNVKSFLASPTPTVLVELKGIGALFGALSSRASGSSAAGLMKMGEDAAKRIIEKLAGATFDLASPTIGVVAIELGKSLVFSVGAEGLSRRQAERDDEDARAGRARREEIQLMLEGRLKHLAFVAMLTDPATRAALEVNLDPAALPDQLPRNNSGRVVPQLDGVDDVDHWRGLVFEDGAVHVPDPTLDRLRWDAFEAWANEVNPKLAQAVNAIYMPMDDAFQRQVVRSV